MADGFFARLTATAQRNNSLLCVGLDPVPSQIPVRFRDAHPGDVPAAMLAWNLAVIEATRDLVCCYKPNIAFYEALGEAGMRVLRATMAAIQPDVPVLLDAKRGDMGPTAEAYARALFDELGADAVTLAPYLGKDSVTPFAAYADRGLFVLAHTSNPSAPTFQHLPVGAEGRDLYLHVAEEAITWSPNVGLVTGATFADEIAAIRSVAPDRWFLVPGIGAQGGDLAGTLAAGLRADGMGLIISASRAVCGAEDARAAALALRDAINAGREKTSATHGSRLAAHESLILALHDLGAVKFGAFTLASGAQSPIYIDLRLLVSQPSLLAQAAKAYAGLLRKVKADRICGVPYAALPIGTAVALEADVPLIYPRKEVKQHGLGKEIEGLWQAGERVVMIEDLITSGGSTIESAERLRAAGLVVEDAIVLIDRQQGGAQKLADAGIHAHAVFTISEMLEVLVGAGRLSLEKQREILEWIGV